MAQGRMLKYLGMRLDYCVKGKVKMSMYDYVKKIIEDVPDDMIGMAKMPVAGPFYD